MEENFLTSIYHTKFLFIFLYGSTVPMFNWPIGLSSIEFDSKTYIYIVCPWNQIKMLHTHTHTHTHAHIYIYIYIYIYSVCVCVMINFRLSYSKMKVTLAYHFIWYNYQNYMKISWNKFTMIMFNRCLRITSESPLFVCRFIWIGKCCFYPSVRCQCCKEFFVGLLINCNPHIIIKGIAI